MLVCVLTIEASGAPVRGDRTIICVAVCRNTSPSLYICWYQCDMFPEQLKMQELGGQESLRHGD
jgi:hypothetical protein